MAEHCGLEESEGALPFETVPLYLKLSVSG